MKHEKRLIADPDGPDECDYGVVRKIRDEGKYKLYLTWDESRSFWWIVALQDEGGVATFGYREDRNLVALETYLALREWELDQVRDHPHRAHRMQGGLK